MNCLNCGALNPPSRSSKPRKYCSAKCTRLFYKKEGRYNNKSYTSKKDIERRAKQKEEFEYAQKHYIRKEAAAEKLNIALGALYHRAKKANVEGIIVYEKGRQRTFYKPEDIKKLQINEPNIPEGYITADKAAEYIGVTSSSFWTLGAKRGRKRPDPSMVQWGIGPHNTRRNLYTTKDLDAWLAEGRKLKQERDATLAKRRLEKEKAEVARLADIKKRTIDAGLITAATAIATLKLVSPYTLKKTPSQKINGQRWYDPVVIKEVALKRETERLERVAQRDVSHRERVPLRENAGSDEAYESQRKQRARCKPPEYVYRNKRSLQNWETHSEPWRLEEEENIITELSCINCDKTLPYTRFYIHLRNSIPERYARSRHCKTCIQDSDRWKNAISRGKSKTPKTRNRMASQIGLSIQRDLAKRNKKYFAMNHKLMWKQIKAYIGYTKDELLDHIESQFKPWMTWANNGRPQDADNPTWQLDHIKPKSSFNYTSIADPEFAKCWALDNLQPLESRLNLLKSNKNLRSRLQSSFNNGIKSKKILRSGIWAHLPYTNLEAKKYFENLFVDDMTWNNWGEKWHIDHTVPQAYLSYTDVEEKNFRYCWALENLKPLARSLNCAKNSRYENKLWFYNNS
jgi:hypothetical protein